MEAPILVIGGQPYVLPPIVFGMVKRAGPIIASMPDLPNDMLIREAMLGVVAIFLGMPSFELQEQVTYVEVTALLGQWADILDWVGLVRAVPGEAPAASSQPIASTI